jgi:hypothetical protein
MNYDVLRYWKINVINGWRSFTLSAVTVWLVLGEVFGCVLSLFMGATDQPLPTDEEVIVCDENTTAEEVG